MRVNLLGWRYFENVAITDQGWLFLNSPVMSNDCQRVAGFSGEELERMAEKMTKVQETALANGVSLHYLMAPNKCTIYPEISAEVFPIPGSTTRADQLIELIAGMEDPVSLIDLRAVLLDAKGSALLYHPDDTHWNENGIFLVHLEMIKALLPDLPDEDYLRRRISPSWIRLIRETCRCCSAWTNSSASPRIGP